jgi:hypothetical protein
VDLVSRVVEALRTLGWRVDLDDEHPGGMLLEPADGEAPWPFLAEVDAEEGQVAIYSLLPDEVPADRRTAVSAVLTEANYSLTVGSFEIDLGDGDVRVRTSIDLGEAELDATQLTALLAPLVRHNLSAMDAWVEILEAVTDGADPADLL